jgi:hypothetical protein
MPHETRGEQLKETEKREYVVPAILVSKYTCAGHQPMLVFHGPTIQHFCELT